MKRLMVFIGLAVTLAGFAAREAAAQEKIFSRQKAFHIPFQIPDPSEQKQLQEVQLYVARNGGKWEKYTSAPPDLPKEKCRFTFRADQDGEYWFAVRTLDKRGVQNPEDDASLQPGLRVVVDSEVPKIDLRPASRGREVGVEWEVQDRNLVLDSLKLEYRIEGKESWQPVPGVVPKFVGQATWVPDSPGRITVRCQVEDRAKNLGIAESELEPAGGAGRPASSPWDRPGAGATTPRESEPNWPSERSPSMPSSPSRFPDSGTKPETTPGGTFNEQRPTSVPNERFAEPIEDVPPSRPSGAGNHPARSPGNAGVSPAPINRQIVRDPEVSLEYKIEDEGPSGVSVIELWVTTDSGRTWQRVGEDDDRRSPFQVNLGDDGLFGLSLVAKSGVGRGDPPPTPGDQPQMWVEVDSTPPQVRLLTPEMGKGPEQGSLVVAWSADDANLGERCVSLFYSDGGKGGWKPIATGVENVGRYVWKMDGQMPYKLRVAIEVSDLAGNRQTQESGEVTIDTSKPKPRISGVSSGGNSRR